MDWFHFWFYILYFWTFKFQLFDLCKLKVHQFKIILGLQRDSMIDQRFYFMVVFLEVGILNILMLL